jgi:hypothetical protein
MYRKKPDVDVIRDILEELQAAIPHSEFVRSLAFQYEERGGLSKKQLEGLLAKASRIDSIAERKLATLAAEIRKRPSRFKSVAPPPKPMYTRDQEVGRAIAAILEKSPQHKRVLFLQSKYENNETITPAEKAELEKFLKLLIK